MFKQPQPELQQQLVPTGHHPELSRRSLLGQAVLASACGIVGFSKHLTANAVCADEQRPVVAPATPEEALQSLYSGNSRFASGKSEANRDMNRVRAVAREQKPFAAFLGCADSRVSIEIVFDQGFCRKRSHSDPGELTFLRANAFLTDRLSAVSSPGSDWSSAYQPVRNRRSAVGIRSHIAAATG